MLNHLSNAQLTDNLKNLVQKESEVLNQVLEHLEEMERRRLYLRLGFSSLFEYCTKELGYSEGAAQRRISSMRLIKEIPQVKEKLESGKLNLTTLSMAQSFFRREEKEQKAKYTSFEKHELLKTLETKSKREVEKELVKINPLSALPKEKERLITPDTFEIKFTLTQEQMEKLKRLKELKPNLLSNQEALDWLLDRVLKQIDPMKFSRPKELNHKAEDKGKYKSSDKNKDELKSEEVKSRARRKALSKLQITPSRKYISKVKKALVWNSANSQCEYISPITKKRCSSKSNLQIDHIRPLAMGGSDDSKNLRLLCQQHNISEAIEEYGLKKMNRYLRV